MRRFRTSPDSVASTQGQASNLCVLSRVRNDYARMIQRRKMPRARTGADPAQAAAGAAAAATIGGRLRGASHGSGEQARRVPGTMPAEDVVRLIFDEVAGTVRAPAREISQRARLAGDRLAGGVRLIYVAARTSGRLGTLDAAGCLRHFRRAAVAGGGNHRPQPARVDPIGGRGGRQPVRGRAADRGVAVGPAEAVCCIAASGVTPFSRAALKDARLRRPATVFVALRSGGPERQEVRARRWPTW